MRDKKGIIGGVAGCGLMLSLAGGVAIAQMPNSEESSTTQFRRIEQPLSVKGVVTAGGLALIGLEVWWFVLSKPKSQT